MNAAADRAAFKERLAELVQSASRTMAPAAADPFLNDGDGAIEVQEATTRTLFLDDLLDALGWTRGAVGDLPEEVRLRGATTVFVDYLGVARLVRAGQRTPVPLLLVEAKAWGKPFIGSRLSGNKLSLEDLLIDGVAHVRRGGTAKNSVLRSDWHDHLVQVASYVRRLAETDEHRMRRVVLTSGDWMLILKDAHEAFLGSGLASDQFVILRLGEYVRRSDEIYFLLGKSQVSKELPDWSTVDRALTYVARDRVSKVFLAAQIAHVRHGSGRIGQMPVLSVVPHVVLVDDLGRQLAVFANDKASHELTGRDVESHLEWIRSAGETILASCAAVFGVAHAPSPLEAYPGLPNDWRFGSAERDRFVCDMPEQPAEWTVITGDGGHFLIAEPLVLDCAFHRWAAGRDAGHPAGATSVSMPTISGPRSLFVDGDRHHCAHGGLIAKREDRCRIAPFEDRLCCQACRFLTSCWSEAERAALPCGSVLDPAVVPVPLDEF